MSHSPFGSPERTARRRHCALGATGAVIALLAGCTVNIGTPSQEPSTPPAAVIDAEPSASAPASWSDAIAATETGVARVISARCDGVATGTAFLVGANQLLTAAHVVDGAQALDVELGGRSTTARVVGFDRAGDVALIQTDVPLAGHQFELADEIPRKGDEVTGLGYPLKATTVVATQGRVSGLDMPVATETFARNDMIETDAGLNPGNSGGPLITLDGKVVGIVSAGDRDASLISFAVPVADAGVPLESWRSAATTTTFPACATAPIPAGWQPSQFAAPDVRIATSDAGAEAVASVILGHGTAINSGDYPAAYSDFTPKMQEYLGSADAWAVSMSPIYWLSATVVAVETRDDGAFLADVELERLGDPAVGGACSTWTKRYTMKTIDGDPRLLIGWVEDIAAIRPCS